MHLSKSCINHGVSSIYNLDVWPSFSSYLLKCKHRDAGAVFLSPWGLTYEPNPKHLALLDQGNSLNKQLQTWLSWYVNSKRLIGELKASIPLLIYITVSQVEKLRRILSLHRLDSDRCFSIYYLVVTKSLHNSYHYDSF